MGWQWPLPHPLWTLGTEQKSLQLPRLWVTCSPSLSSGLPATTTAPEAVCLTLNWLPDNHSQASLRWVLFYALSY